MNNQLQDLAAVLRDIESNADPTTEYDVVGAVRRLYKELEEIGEEPKLELLAEELAFSFVDGCKDSPWGTYFGPKFVFEDGECSPDIGQITADMISYWAVRATETKHPYLQARYADLTWDFCQKITGQRSDVGMAAIAIDATIRIAENQQTTFEHRIFKMLERALSVALGINDHDRIVATRDQIIALENAIARDEMAGTWGYAFDLLVQNKKVPLDQDQEDSIIQELEKRLTRLCERADGTSDIHAAQLLALRLEKYYKRLQRLEECNRVLRSYGSTVLRACESLPKMVSNHWLGSLFEIYSSRGMKRESGDLSSAISEYGEAATEEMTRFSTTMEISSQELEDYYESFCDGDVSEALCKAVFHFIPDPEEIERQVRDLAEKSPLLAILPQAIMDQGGRTVAKVGSVEEDLDGNVVNQMAQNLAFEAMFLRGVLERIQVRYRLSVDDLVSIFSLSPLFQYVAEPVLRVGLAAYLNGEFITAISTLTPQIEALVRSLVRIEEGRMYKPGKRGGLLVRTLDDLLRDEVIRQVLGDRTVKYLCVLLTDQRGWNFRNNVCHGLMASTAYDAHRADRVFHAIMLFAFIRLQPATTAETTDAIAAE